MKPLGIRAKLTAWYSLILALSLGAFGAVAYLTMAASIRSTADAGLHARLEGLRAIIEEDSPKGRAALEDEIKEFADGLGTGGRVRVADTASGVIYQSPGMESWAEPSRRSRFSRPFYGRIDRISYRVLRENIDFAGVRYEVELALSMEDYARALNRFRIGLFLAVPILLAIAALGGYWMSRRALAPVDEITRAACNIGAHDLARRLAVPRADDELARLTVTLNEMLARLDAAFRRITQFTADASHELRTPVAVIRTSAELTLRKPRTEAEYREALAQILREAEKVSQLIEQLLTLARADAVSAALPLTRVDVSLPLRNACSQAEKLARAKHIALNAPASIENPVTVAGDASSLERLFLIVLDNAVKYTPEDGRVDVSLFTQGDSAIIEIRDTGIGIDAAHIPLVFDRFYRVDRVRGSESGGAGLGLAIGRWIAEAHRGNISVHSESTKGVTKGSTFRIELPLLPE